MAEKGKAIIVYYSAIEEETVWRKKASPNDILLLENMLKKIQDNGFENIKYLADIFYRKIDNSLIIGIIQETILEWEDIGIEVQLVAVIGKKGNKNIIETIFKSYNLLNDDEKNRYQAFYDNALNNSFDKNFIDVYLPLAKEWRDVANFPLVMKMLCSMNISETKDLLIEQLFSKVDFELFNPIEYWTQRNQAYINSIVALENYPTKDIKIVKALEKLITSTNCTNLKDCAKNALNKIKSRFS